MQSVVMIETYGGINIGGGPAPKQPPKSDRPGQKRAPTGMQGIAKPGEGPTTGLIISTDGYMLTIVDRGADILFSQNLIGKETAAALKEEARRRLQSGRFFGHLAYAGLIARKV